MFLKDRLKNWDSLLWLLKEPVVHGTRLRYDVEPGLSQNLCQAKVLTLGHVVEVCGPHLAYPAGVTFITVTYAQNGA